MVFRKAIRMLPSWFGVRFLKEEHDLEKLLICSKKRIDLLYTFKTMSKETLVNELNDVCVSRGFVGLFIAASIGNDPFFLNWFLESEGDIFSILFSKASYTEKIEILTYIFKKLYIGLDSISLELGIDVDKLKSELFSVVDLFRDSRKSKIIIDSAFVMVPFHSGYRLVRYGRGIVMKGYIITTVQILLRMSKSIYQQHLTKEIKLFRIQIRTDPKLHEALKIFSKNILGYWKHKSRVSTSNAKAQIDEHSKLNVWHRVELFPPCSLILYNQFKSTGYLPHGERLQLGLFLKALGMPVEEQLKFWYSAVDNVGLSWEEFLKKGGYYIRHIYGLEGSKKDYSAPKCDTIIAKYFCPFSKLTLLELKKVLQEIDPKLSDKDFNQIKTILEQGNPKLACGIFLSLYAAHKFGTKPKRIREITHPVQYVKILLKLMKIFGRKEKLEKKMEMVPNE